MKVLKPFLYGADGINSVAFVPGDVGEFGDSTEGLLKEGYIEAEKAAPPKVEAKPTLTVRK